MGSKIRVTGEGRNLQRAKVAYRQNQTFQSAGRAGNDPAVQFIPDIIMVGAECDRRGGEEPWEECWKPVVVGVCCVGTAHKGPPNGPARFLYLSILVGNCWEGTVVGRFSAGMTAVTAVTEKLGEENEDGTVGIWKEERARAKQNPDPRTCDGGQY
jgi:hypothetical protein